MRTCRSARTLSRRRPKAPPVQYLAFRRVLVKAFAHLIRVVVHLAHFVFETEADLVRRRKGQALGTQGVLEDVPFGKGQKITADVVRGGGQTRKTIQKTIGEINNSTARN